MATTVNGAFIDFMRDKVNLDSKIVVDARKSRDNLLQNIAEFNGQDGFFNLWEPFNLHFGSFARKTKCRELDDIDLMIGVSADGATYCPLDPWDNIKINSSTSNSAHKDCTRDDGTLNSIQVTNRFKKKLESVREYSRSETRRNGEAVILNLISKDWSFDIVPCFHTDTESDGKSYYLIPNGNGNWKKTNPEKDREHVINTNQSKANRVLELIRLCKKWNKVKKIKTVPSYLLETMIVNYCDSKLEIDQRINVRFGDSLNYIASHIDSPINDMKEIQGDINNILIEDRQIIKQKARTDYTKACEAIIFEVDDNNHKKAIDKWGEILGGDFPNYEY